MPETNLSAEEPSERAATGGRLSRVKWKNDVRIPGGAKLKVDGEIEAPAGGRLERATSLLVMVFAVVAVPAVAAVGLTLAGVPAWLIVLIVAPVLLVVHRSGIAGKSRKQRSED